VEKIVFKYSKNPQITNQGVEKIQWVLVQEAAKTTGFEAKRGEGGRFLQSRPACNKIPCNKISLQ
jgi:hypothetical protein